MTHPERRAWVGSCLVLVGLLRVSGLAVGRSGVRCWVVGFVLVKGACLAGGVLIDEGTDGDGLAATPACDAHDQPRTAQPRTAKARSPTDHEPPHRTTPTPAYRKAALQPWSAENSADGWPARLDGRPRSARTLRQAADQHRWTHWTVWTVPLQLSRARVGPSSPHRPATAIRAHTAPTTTPALARNAHRRRSKPRGHRSDGLLKIGGSAVRPPMLIHSKPGLSTHQVVGPCVDSPYRPTDDSPNHRPGA